MCLALHGQHNNLQHQNYLLGHCRGLVSHHQPPNDSVDCVKVLIDFFLKYQSKTTSTLVCLVAKVVEHNIGAKKFFFSSLSFVNDFTMYPSFTRQKSDTMSLSHTSLVVMDTSFSSSSCLSLFLLDSIPNTPKTLASDKFDKTVHKPFCIYNVVHPLCIHNLCEKHSSPLHRDATNCDVINHYYVSSQIITSPMPLHAL